MRWNGHLSGREWGFVVVSVANIGLLATAAFFKRDEGAPDRREKIGYVAVSLASCGQAL